MANRLTNKTVAQDQGRYGMASQNLTLLSFRDARRAGPEPMNMGFDKDSRTAVLQISSS